MTLTAAPVTERLAFTSRTTARLDALAAEHGWARYQNRMGDLIQYKRNTLYVDISVSVTGGLIRVSTNRHGGRFSVGAGKAERVTEWLAE